MWLFFSSLILLRNLNANTAVLTTGLAVHARQHSLEDTERIPDTQKVLCSGYTIAPFLSDKG